MARIENDDSGAFEAFETVQRVVNRDQVCEGKRRFRWWDSCSWSVVTGRSVAVRRQWFWWVAGRMNKLLRIFFARGTRRN